ncbi:hypothetical protein HYI43_09075 [Staphylococcus taiwanensis]|nr:hypothetical protein HYI43_09075 [Staphylococcus taiwanensis]
MNIKQLSLNNEVVNVYLYINNETNNFMLAIPDIFWSVELQSALSNDEIKEELTMQLFNFKDEEDAEEIALILTDWIVNDIKGDY